MKGSLCARRRREVAHHGARGAGRARERGQGRGRGRRRRTITLERVRQRHGHGASWLLVLGHQKRWPVALFSVRERKDGAPDHAGPTSTQVPGGDAAPALGCGIQLRWSYGAPGHGRRAPVAQDGKMDAAPPRPALPHGPHLRGQSRGTGAAVRGVHARRRRADARPPLRGGAGGRGARAEERRAAPSSGRRREG